jgi:hypothetical protein
MTAQPNAAQPLRAKGRIRGVTRKKYHILRRMIARKETTWAQLEREGIVLPPANESDYARNVRDQLRKRR